MSLGRLLIVEANPGTLMVARNILAREGFDVFTAWEEGEGFRRACSHEPDLLILDGGLARPETLNAFARARNADLPVLLVSWKGRGDLLLESVRTPQLSDRLKLRGCVEKPFVAEQLILATHRALGRASSNHSAGRRGPSSISRPDELITLEESIEEIGLPLGELKALLGESNISPRAQTLAQNIVEGLEERALGERDRLQLAHICERALQNTPSPALPESNADRTIRIELEPIHAPVGNDTQVDLKPRSALELKTPIPASPQTEPMLSGSLGALTPDQFFQFAESLPMPVICEIDRGTARVEVFFKDRMIIFARQENMREVFALGRFLVDRGLVEQSVIDRLVLMGASPEGLLGQRLLTQGLLKADDLTAVLQHQTAELVYEVLQWRKGKISLYLAPEFPQEAKTANIAFPVAHLLLEGMRRLDESHRIIEELGGPKAIPSRTPLSDDELLETLPPTSRRVLSQIDGQQNVEELIKATNRPVLDVWQALKDLRGQRLVTVLESPQQPQ